MTQEQLSPDHSPDKSDEPETVVSESGLAFCYRHPDVETGLRCNRCNKPICPKCAQRTPVGFRCPDCIREQEDKFFTGTNTDYLIAVVITLPLSLIAAGLYMFILSMIGFWGWIVGGAGAARQQRVYGLRVSTYAESRGGQGWEGVEWGGLSLGGPR